MAYGYRVYFTERAKHRVVRWDPDTGAVATVAGGEAAGAVTDQQLRDPYGLAIDRGGHLLIADKLNHRITRMTSRMESLPQRVMGSHRQMGAQTPLHRRVGLEVMQCPTGLFQEDDGNLLCAYSDDHTIYRMRPEGRLEWVLGVPPNRPQVFGAFQERVPLASIADVGIWGPTGVVKRKDGVIFFIERGYQEVRIYEPGVGLRALFPHRLAIAFRDRPVAPERAALNDYHSTYPSSLALDGAGRLFMADATQGVVMHIDLEAGVVSKVIDLTGVGGGQGGPVAMAFGPDGTAWVLESRTGSVRSYRPNTTGAWAAQSAMLNSRPGEGLTINHGGAGLVCGP